MNADELLLREFFEKAYWLQRGEYFPHLHLQNIDELCRTFPWERAVIDALYRILPHLDFVAKEAARKVVAGTVNQKDAFQELCLPVFHYIPDSLKKTAWEIHLSEAGL